MMKSDMPEELLTKIDRSGLAGAGYCAEMVRIAQSAKEAREAEAQLGTFFLTEIAGRADVVARCGITRQEADNLATLTYKQGWQGETKKPGSK